MNCIFIIVTDLIDRFGWEDAGIPKVCMSTVKLMNAALQCWRKGWIPAGHLLFHGGVRTAVHTVLMVVSRLKHHHQGQGLTASTPSAARYNGDGDGDGNESGAVDVGIDDGDDDDDADADADDDDTIDDDDEEIGHQVGANVNAIGVVPPHGAPSRDVVLGNVVLPPKRLGSTTPDS